MLEFRNFWVAIVLCTLTDKPSRYGNPEYITNNCLIFDSDKNTQIMHKFTYLYDYMVFEIVFIKRIMGDKILSKNILLLPEN